MPTGYTVDIHDGKAVTFEQFAWGCARAFGALIEMRDDPKGAAIPDFEPSDYHAKALSKAQERLSEVLTWALATARQKADDAYRKAHDEWIASQERTEAMRVRYEAMLEQAMVWEPPSPEHQEFKNFMVQQLAESIRFDCPKDRSWYPEPTPLGAADYKDQEVERAQRDIAHHAAQHAADVERTAERNLWVRALRRTLGDPPTEQSDEKATQ